MQYKEREKKRRDKYVSREKRMSDADCIPPKILDSVHSHNLTQIVAPRRLIYFLLVAIVPAREYEKSMVKLNILSEDSIPHCPTMLQRMFYSEAHSLNGNHRPSNNLASIALILLILQRRENNKNGKNRLRRQLKNKKIPQT